tara:strand:+ start:334 stop:648 length:315 start_codon:yes stop_codon:yes gene_type:complete
MQQEKYNKLKISLQAINKIKIQKNDNQSFSSKKKVKDQTLHLMIDLGEFTIIVAGQLRKFYKVRKNDKSIWFGITVLDSELEEQTPTKPQHTEIKKEISKKLVA